MKKDLAISIQNLVKEYQIRKGGQSTSFRALDNINLEVEKGRVLGIIGQNGAGKSTLLKILSRITYPTQGEALYRGSLSSLLEVGTGFHPELSGRENIFLNGAILGMSRSQIRNRFDEILEFSGIGNFIETPVKHYSSGMYVRLAFSVAANLSPDILLIDEVLAVGDAAFQQKCLQRTDRARKEEGRTVLFISHNMSAIRELCDEVVWLREGRIHQKGEPDEITNNYLHAFQEVSENIPIAERQDRIGSGDIKLNILRWEVPGNVLISGKPASLHMAYESKNHQQIAGLNLRLNVFKENGEFLTSLSNEMAGIAFSDMPGSGELSCHFDALPFMAGSYYITSNLFMGSIKTDKVDRALSFKVAEGNRDLSGALKTRQRAGVKLAQDWRKQD